MDTSERDDTIRHVSDTALWVAGARALETDHAEAVIRDPLARRLAGERGVGLATSMPHPEFFSFGIGLRVRFMDDIIERLGHCGELEAVLNIGAGLDTRPYRLRLPPAVRWVEADLPDLIEYKTAVLEGETPHCRLERIAADLSDGARRREVFAGMECEAKRVLLISEGLLGYLSGEAIRGIARDAHAAGFRYWMLDLMSEQMRRQMDATILARIHAVRDPDGLTASQTLEAIAAAGWGTQLHRSYYWDCVPFVGTRFAGMSRTPPAPPPLNDGGGVWLEQRV